MWNGRCNPTQLLPLVRPKNVLGHPNCLNTHECPLLSSVIYCAMSTITFLNLYFFLEGHLPVMGVYQNFEDNPTSSWCSLPEGPSSLAMRLDKRPVAGSSLTVATLYRWQGVLVPVEVG